MSIKLSQSQIEAAKKWNYYKNNPVEFFEDCCNLPATGGDKLIKLHKPQRKIVSAFYSGKNSNMIFLKSRQIGFSTLFQLICTHLVIFFSNAIIGVTSRNGAEASDFARKTKDIIDKLPIEFKPAYKWNNIKDFCISKTNSQLYSDSVSPTNPGSLFRGKSICLLIMDEIAHVMKAEEGWTGVAPALSSAQMVAKENQVPYGTILLSTPNRCTGIGKFFYTMWRQALDDTNGFQPYRVHWTEIDSYRNDPNWYTNQCKLLNNDPRKIQQELELQFVGDENTFLPEETVRTLQSSTIEPKKKIPICQGGEIWKFVDKIDPTRFYMIGVDISSSYGSDYCAIEGLDWITMNQILEYKGKVTPKNLSDVVRAISAMLPKNIIIIERTGGWGNTVLTELEYDKLLTYNIFQEYRRSDPAKKRIPGLSTDNFTRPLIIQALYETVVEHPELIKSERLKLELLSLIRKGERIEADQDAHDDIAMSYAFCCYVRKHYAETIQIEEDTGEELPNILDTYDTISDLNDVNPIGTLHFTDEFQEFKSHVETKIINEPKKIRKKDILKAIYGESFVKTYLNIDI